MRPPSRQSLLGFLILGTLLSARGGRSEEIAEAGDKATLPAASECEAAGKPPPDPWLKIPPVRLFPRLGNFPNPPTGPGHYSLLDLIEHNQRAKRPRFPYPPFALMPFSFFDADFRYLDDPKNTQHDLFDPLHRCHIGQDWLFNTGGEFRWRHMHEINSRLTGTTNDYDLLRTRVYGDLWYKDCFRIYGEFLDAHSFNQNLVPLPIDVNRSDILNLFMDLKLGEIKDKPVYVRVGRQELPFGSQRLISPLDWAGTRRTFQGVRAFRQGEKFDVDAFWVQPVIPSPSHLDSVDNNVNFAGLWTTYRPKAGQFIDAYYLFLDHVTPQRLLGEPRSFPSNVSTLGTRWAGDKNQWLWDVEGMLQFGSRGSQELFAAAGTVGGGYHFKNVPLNPTFWVYYDYASGDEHPGTGDKFTTFNQLFPFGHYYLGWLDLVGRQNIHDINAHLYIYPMKWITVWTQYHHFELASAQDALYNAAGVPLRRDATGQAGHDVGDEIDIVVNFHAGPHSDVMVGYSKLFAGEFIHKTATTAARSRSPELFFLMYNFRW
jgi:hypothetical protein